MENNLFENSNLSREVLKHLKALKDKGIILGKLKTSEAPLIIFINSLHNEQEIFHEQCQKFQFTQRETEIALFLEKGFSYKEISRQLHISVKTVSRHINNLYFKADVCNKIALIRKLKNHG